MKIKFIIDDNGNVLRPEQLMKREAKGWTGTLQQAFKECGGTGKQFVKECVGSTGDFMKELGGIKK